MNPFFISRKVPGLLIAAFIVWSLCLYQPTVASGSCSRFHSCCNSSVSTTCRGEPIASSNCYCDKLCYIFNDCCSDINTTAACFPSSSIPSINNGSCASVGFTGCCDPNTATSCYGSNGYCLCDQDCYSYGDCCADINSLCRPPTNGTGPTTSPPTSGTCAAAGYTTCCGAGNSLDCHGSPNDCFCDQTCYEFGDCCSDIETICAGTFPPDTNHGHCTGMGYNGCCQLGSSGNNTHTCFGSDGKCYCDQNCFYFGDCCEDIDETGCRSPIQATPTQGSCVAAGFLQCCDSQAGTYCWGTGGSKLCYCDESCYSYDDCCPDVGSIGCIAPSVTPTAESGTCLTAGHPVCCVKSDTNPCLGSNGICSCSADCYDTGTCCGDIDKLGCVIQTPTLGPCQQAGYKQCCNPQNQNGSSCYGNPPTCYCDLYCYAYGDCCPDMAAINCVNDTIVKPANGSCLKAGYKTCCVPSSSDPLCLGHPENCYCDENCHQYGDCCNDIADIGCTPAQLGSCIGANYQSCCPLEDLSCLGQPNSNCYCDEACKLRDDCCLDKFKLKNCSDLTIPGPVNNLRTMSLSSTSFMVMWDPPTYPYKTFLYYTYVSNYTGEGEVKPRVQLAIDVRKENITGLRPFVPYNVTVIGRNVDGLGINRTIINFTQEGIPTEGPDNIRLTHSGSNLYVSWSPLSPIKAQGLVRKYLIHYFPITDLNNVMMINTSTTSVTIPNVSGRVRYGVRVAAVTSAGVGVLSKSMFEAGGTNPKTPVNIPTIVGSIAGGVGILAVIIVIILVIVLTLKTRNRPSGRQRYKQLLVHANSEVDDSDSDDDMITYGHNTDHHHDNDSDGDFDGDDD